METTKEKIRREAFRDAANHILDTRRSMITTGRIGPDSIEAQDLAFAAGLIYGGLSNGNGTDIIHTNHRRGGKQE